MFEPVKNIPTAFDFDEEAQGGRSSRKLNVEPSRPSSEGFYALIAASLVQENFAEYDVPWRNDLVNGWNPIQHGEFVLPDQPGLGLELNEQVCAQHPYRKNSFPSLWDDRWLKEFTKKQSDSPSL